MKPEAFYTLWILWDRDHREARVCIEGEHSAGVLLVAAFGTGGDKQYRPLRDFVARLATAPEPDYLPARVKEKIVR